MMGDRPGMVSEHPEEVGWLPRDGNNCRFYSYCDTNYKILKYYNSQWYKTSPFKYKIKIWGWWISVLMVGVYYPEDNWWLARGWWLTILGKVGDHPWNCGWPSRALWVTILGMVGYHPGVGGWLSFQSIFRMVDDHLFGWWVTILGMVGDYPVDVEWSSMALHLVLILLVKSMCQIPCL